MKIIPKGNGYIGWKTPRLSKLRRVKNILKKCVDKKTWGDNIGNVAKESDWEIWRNEEKAKANIFVTSGEENRTLTIE